MGDKSFGLRIVTPAETLLDQANVSWVQAQLADGGIGIWPGHAPLLAELTTGLLRYADEAGEQELVLEGGILHITETEVKDLCK